MSRAGNQLATSVGRLSSGLRIREARDDAAGLGISLRMGSEAAASRRITQGINDGIGLLQTAEGGLAGVGDKLQRARELAVQAANATLRPSDRAALAAEYAGLMQDIDRLAHSTEFNGIFPLLGPVAGSTPALTGLFPTSGASLNGHASGIKPIAYVPTGATGVVLEIDSRSWDDDIQVFTRDGRHLAGTPLGDSTWTMNGVASASDVQAKVLTPANGFTAGAAYDASGLLDGSLAYTDPATAPPGVGLSGTFGAMNLVYSGDGDRHDGSPNDGSVPGGYTRERLLISQATEPLIVMVVGSGVFDAQASWSSMPDPDARGRTGPLEIPVSAGVHDAMHTVTVEQAPADLVALGLESSDLGSRDAAAGALSALDVALERVWSHRASLAASSSRLDRAVDTLGLQHDTAQASRARIVDADYAAESAALVRAKVLANASQAMLAQSKTSAEWALSLLRDP